ncbi:MAG TPA: T9SS type A sorting domain-containing protein, partial [Bacteroidota bacterium]
RVAASGDGGTSSNSETRSFTTASPLPVEMTSFVASSQRFDAELRWSTATETNTYGFSVERDFTGPLSGTNTVRSGGSWVSAGFVKAAGTSATPRTYLFSDRSLPPGRYSYRLKTLDTKGSAGYSRIVDVEVGTAPRIFSLAQNYPNPFNPTTKVEFTIPEDGNVKLVIYNMLGQEVETILDRPMKAGEYHQADFNGSRFSSGIYFSVLRFNNKQLVKKMLLIK